MDRTSTPIRKSARRSTENFRRQIRTMLQKGERIRSSFEADVYIQVRRNGKIYIYKSSQEGLWPLNKTALVGIYSIISFNS